MRIGNDAAPPAIARELPSLDTRGGGPRTDAGQERVTIGLIADRSWRTEEMAVQLLRWRYSILWLRPFDLALSGAQMQRAALILTTQTRWQIERILGPAHPPVVTTDDFDLRLQTRIEACLKSRGLVPPVGVVTHPRLFLPLGQPDRISGKTLIRSLFR